MNQRVFAGIGNIYSDEILFQVRLHPRTTVGRLDEGALHDLPGTTERSRRRKRRAAPRTTVQPASQESNRRPPSGPAHAGSRALVPGKR
jgi:formamidopyrimidine-DNA glycosylase